MGGQLGRNTHGIGDDIARTSEESAPAPELFAILPCVGEKIEYPVTKEYIAQMKPLYPGVDIEKETLRAKGYLINNPKKRKTCQGTRSCTTWWTRFIGTGMASR